MKLSIFVSISIFRNIVMIEEFYLHALLRNLYQQDMLCSILIWFYINLRGYFLAPRYTLTTQKSILYIEGSKISYCTMNSIAFHIFHWIRVCLDICLQQYHQVYIFSFRKESSLVLIRRKTFKILFCFVLSISIRYRQWI